MSSRFRYISILEKKRKSGHFRLIFFIVSKVEPINTRWLVSVMVIKGCLTNLTILNPFDDYLVKGLRNIDFDDRSMSIGRRGQAICSIDSIGFSKLKKAVRAN